MPETSIAALIIEDTPIMGRQNPREMLPLLGTEIASQDISRPLFPVKWTSLSSLACAIPPVLDFFPKISPRRGRCWELTWRPGKRKAAGENEDYAILGGFQEHIFSWLHKIWTLCLLVHNLWCSKEYISIIF